MKPEIRVIFINLVIILLLLLEDRADSRAVDATYENLRGIKERETPISRIMSGRETLFKQGMPSLPRMGKPPFEMKYGFASAETSGFS